MLLGDKRRCAFPFLNAILHYDRSTGRGRASIFGLGHTIQLHLAGLLASTASLGFRGGSALSSASVSPRASFRPPILLSESSELAPAPDLGSAPAADDDLAGGLVDADVLLLAALGVDKALGQAQSVAQMKRQRVQVARQLAQHRNVLGAAALGVLVDRELQAGRAGD